MMINKMIAGLILLLAFSGGLKAQSWGSIGDRWVYSLAYTSETKYMLLEVKKDTIVAGESCKLFASTIIEYTGPAGAPVTSYIRTDTPGSDYYFKAVGDSVFWYDGNQFVFTFPLDAPMAYEWEVPPHPTINCDTTTPPPADLHEVNSRDTVNILSGHTIVQLSIGGSGDWMIGDKVYVGVGPSRSLFPLPGINCMNPSATIGHPRSLGCHYNSATGATTEYSAGTDFCNDIISSEKAPLAPANQSPLFYPNPIQEHLQVSVQDRENVLLSIYDVMGRLLFERRLSDSIVDVSFLEKGIYFFSLRDLETSQLIITEKMIKL